MIGAFISAEWIPRSVSRGCGAFRRNELRKKKQFCRKVPLRKPICGDTCLSGAVFP